MRPDYCLEQLNHALVQIQRLNATEKWKFVLNRDTSVFISALNTSVQFVANALR